MNHIIRTSFMAFKNIFLVFFISFLIVFKSFAQNSDLPKEVTTTFFLKNINIIQKPGVTLTEHHLVIKNGLIDAIGKDIKPPHNARIILGDSMFVYAGFIDAFSHTGIPKPENRDQPKIPDPGNPPNDVAGITPQNDISSVYKNGDKSVGELRSMGFTMSNVSPRGFMLPGKTSLIQLIDGEPDAAVFKKDVGMTAQFTTNRGTYPSTIIGVMSKFRELYKNSEILGQNIEKYNATPIGISRPVLKKEEWALFPVTKKTLPVYFVASSSNQISRALQLQKEMGYSMVLTEVKQGWDWVDQIKNQQVKVLLSLDFQEDKKDTKEDKSKDKDVKEKPKVKDKVTKPLSEEEIAFEKKRQESLTQHLNQAAVFEKAGIPFGFSFMNGKPADIHKTIRKLVKNGLSEKAALEALTINPANMFGLLPYAGTIDKGKLANLVVMDKSFFDEKSSVKYVFVDGILFDYSKKSSKKDENGGEKSKLTGSWSFEAVVGNITHSGTLTISLKDSEYSVSMVSDADPDKSESGYNIEVKDDRLTFSISPEFNGRNVTFDCDLEFDGSNFTGELTSTELGTFKVSGERKSDPKSF